MSFRVRRIAGSMMDPVKRHVYLVAVGPIPRRDVLDREVTGEGGLAEHQERRTFVHSQKAAAVTNTAGTPGVLPVTTPPPPK